MRRKMITISIISLLLLSACVQTQQLETLGIINASGTDISAEDSLIENTLIIFQFNDQAKSNTNTVSGTSKTLKGAREDANSKLSFNLSPGQIRLELYGKETAQQGIARYLGALNRDARVSETMLLAVCSTTAKDILTKGQQNTSINIGQYLHGLIEQEYKDDTIPRVSLHEFGHTFSDVGLDPVLPVISLINNTPTLTALAVFQDDKYVDEISLEDAFLINLFHKRINNSPVELTIPGKPFKKYRQYKQIHPDTLEELDLRITVNGNSKTKVTNIDQLNFKTTIDLEIAIQEITEFVSVENEKAGKLLEKEIAKEFKRQYEDLLKKLQEINSDPFGFGSIYRANSKHGKLTRKEWREKFPDIKVNFDVNVKLMEYGTVQ